VPPSLQAVIDRCLEKDPERRYQNVAELAIALLPFAPSRARLYAQRASSILGGKTDSVIPAPLPMPAALTRSYVSEPIPQTSMLALPMPEISAPPVFGRRESRGAADPRTSRVLTGLALAGLGAACVMLWLGAQRSIPTGSRVDSPVTAAPAAPLPLEQEAEEAPELALSRTVLVESQPSGALVKVGGQALGLTPLSTLLPVGTQQLSISKQGYSTEQAFVQLDAAPAGAKAVRTRVILREEAAPPAAEPVARSRPAAPVRAARRPPATRRAEPQREELPVATASAEPAPEPVQRVEPSAPPLLEERSRVKLLETEGRARLLE
jgi:eukaryotic-like serine/threonine-protein kinase